MSNLELSTTLKGHTGPITNLKYNKDNAYLVSSSQDSTICIWNIQTGKKVLTNEKHMGSVNSFALSSRDTQILSGGADGALCFFDIQQNDLIRRIRCHDGAINSVCYNEDDSIAISAGFDSKVKIWDSRSNSGTPVQVLDHSKDSITSVTTGSYEIFTSSVDGKLRTYDIRNAQVITDSVCDSIVHIELPKGQTMILITTREQDSRIILYIKSNGEVQQTYKGHTCTEYHVCSHFAANDAVVISGSELGEVFVWDSVSSEIRERFSFGDGPILDVAASNPFTSIAAGSADGNIGIFCKKKDKK